MKWSRKRQMHDKLWIWLYQTFQILEGLVWIVCVHVHKGIRINLSLKQLHGGFSSQWSHSASPDMKADKVQVVNPPPPRWLCFNWNRFWGWKHSTSAPICLMGDSPLRGTNSTREIHQQPPILRDTCSVTHLNCSELRLNASLFSPKEE